MKKQLSISYQRTSYTPQIKERKKILRRRLNLHLYSVQIYAGIIASFVYLLSIALTVSFGRAVWAGEMSAIVMLLLLLVCIWCMTPRVYGYPPAIVLADANQFPRLNETVRQIADLIGVTPPALFITEKHDAAFVRLGWQRRAVIEIGHPLLSVLTMRETLLLLSHEVAHAADRAFTRSLYVRIVYGMLYRWDKLFDPANLSGWQRLFVPFAFIMWVIFRPIYLQLCACISIDYQAAEHWADGVAAQIAGGEDAAELYFKLTLGHYTAFATAYNHAAPEQKYALARHTVANLPDTICQRVKQFMLTCPAPRFALHPCAGERLEHSRQYANRAAYLTLTVSHFAAMHTELRDWPSIMAAREANYYAQHSCVNRG